MLRTYAKGDTDMLCGVGRRLTCWSELVWDGFVGERWGTYAGEGFGVADEEIVKVGVYCQCIGAGFLQERVLAVVFYCALDSHEGRLRIAAVTVVNVLV